MACVLPFSFVYNKNNPAIIFSNAAVFRSQVVPQLLYKQTCISLGCLWKQIFFLKWNLWFNRGRALLLSLFSLFTLQGSMIVIMHIGQPNEQVSICVRCTWTCKSRTKAEDIRSLYKLTLILFTQTLFWLNVKHIYSTRPLYCTLSNLWIVCVLSFQMDITQAYSMNYEYCLSQKKNLPI